MKRLLFLLLFASSLFARKVLVVSLPGITIEELLAGQNKNIISLAGRGAVGLANCRLTKAYPLESAYLAMGSARRITGRSEARLCLESGELLNGARAEELYNRYWGLLPPSNSLMHIGFPAVVESNSSLRGKSKYTLLGDLLAERGVKTVLLGNADTLLELHREAGCVLMDSRGLIGGGELGRSLLTLDPTFPGGLRTDFSKLKMAVRKYLSDNVFLLIETGDPLRIDSQAPYISEERRGALLDEFLKSVDDLLGYIASFLKEEDVLVIISPYPGRFALDKGQTLSPIVVVGGGMRGLLTSGTTKNPGVVSLYDFAPTILSFFGGEVERLYLGDKMHSQPVEDPLQTILRIRQANWRSWLIHKLISSQIITLTLGSFLLGFILPLGYPSSRFLALFPFIIPLALLLLAPCHLNQSEIAFALPLLSLLIFLLCSLRSSKCPLYIAFCLLILITLDILNGGQLMALSGIGHSVEEGARYYGIGNEFMGLLIGTMLLLNYYYPRFPLYWLVWGILTLLVGASWWGANWGGFLTALSCLIYIGIDNAKGKKWMYLIPFLILLLVLPIIIDIFTPHTHIGLAFRGLFLGRVGDFLNLLQRKVMTNVNLLRHSDWTIPLITQGVLLLIFYTFRYLLPREKAPIWLKAVFLAALVAFAFNDSGVVASVFLLIPVVALVLVEEIPIELVKQKLWKNSKMNKEDEVDGVVAK